MMVAWDQDYKINKYKVNKYGNGGDIMGWARLRETTQQQSPFFPRCANKTGGSSANFVISSKRCVFKKKSIINVSL